MSDVTVLRVIALIIKCVIAGIVFHVFKLGELEIATCYFHGGKNVARVVYGYGRIDVAVEGPDGNTLLRWIEMKFQIPDSGTGSR